MMKTHGMKNTPEYKAWCEAKRRCHNPTSYAYKDYGGRGITMAAEWLNDFQAFFDHVGRRPDGYQIDRIDNDKGYEPGNVRWATVKENQNNKRTSVRITYLGKVMTVEEYAKEKGLSRAGAWARLKLYPQMIEGERDKKFGERHPRAKLSNLAVVEIRSSAEKANDLALKFGVSATLINRIRKGLSRRVL